MGKWLLAFLLLLAAAAGAAYYWLFRPQAQALETCRQESTTIVQQAAGLRTRVADLESIRDQLEKSSGELKQQVQEKEKELAGLHSTQDELLGQLKQEVADRQVQIEQIKDQLRVEMVDEVLFDSGEAALKPGRERAAQGGGRPDEGREPGERGAGPRGHRAAAGGPGHE